MLCIVGGRTGPADPDQCLICCMAHEKASSCDLRSPKFPSVLRPTPLQGRASYASLLPTKNFRASYGQSAALCIYA